MPKSPFQLFKRRTHPGKRADSFANRGLGKYLPTSKGCLQTNTGRYVAEFSSGFSAGRKSHDLIEQIDALTDAGQVIKGGETCHVSRITWNGRDVVVKRYNHKGLIHSLRHTIKKSRARKAWLHAHHLEALNIATPKPLAYIEHHKGSLVWQSYLITEYVEGQMLYNLIRDETIAEPQRLDAIRQVVELLDKLWRHHITHGDLKHTNLLMTQNGPVLTDLDGMLVHRYMLLYRNKRTKDMERFLRKTNVSPELHQHCLELILSAAVSDGKFMDDFDRTRIDNWTVRIHKSLPKNEIGSLLSLSDSSDNQGAFTRVPSSDQTRVFRCNISVDGTDHPFYLKRYLTRSTLDFVKHIFRPSRAKRSYNASLMLQKNGFDAPAVIGLFERRHGPFCVDNSLLTEDVENTGSMMQVLTDICRGSDGNALIRKRGLIEAFAQTVGRLHARGIFHGDLRLGNVLVVKEGRKWRFFFIDNERTRKFYRLPSRLRLKNLVQVNMIVRGISNTDRLRFFRTYLSMNPSVQKRYAGWAQKIIAKTNSRLSRKDWFENESPQP
ncbi:MAG: lipopolysaccharide kinase InaA family protein [Planctomycetota bacterium]|jgi:tRNA A-37 threonylcarbamoyl transferase component Bud32